MRRERRGGGEGRKGEGEERKGEVRKGGREKGGGSERGGRYASEEEVIPSLLYHQPYRNNDCLTW